MLVFSILVARHSKAWVCGRVPAEVVGLNPSVCSECYVLSDRNLCNELITCPEESY